MGKLGKQSRRLTLESLGESSGGVARGRNGTEKGRVKFIRVGGRLEGEAANAAGAVAAAAGAATEASGAADRTLLAEGVVSDGQAAVVASGVAADGGGALHGGELVVWTVAV